MSESSFPTIPGYVIQEIAGQGGMGVVYRAEQVSPRRPVAVKLISRPDAARLAAFRREAELIAGLEHPHILPVYTFGEVEGQPYLVMRYVAGGSLAERIKEGGVPLQTAVRWLTRIAHALDFAHQQGIVHQDVKPSNVLLDQSGQLYLTDFGIAGALQTAQETPAGSAAYMAPEQARGEAVDARSDVYALAVMAYELLTGQRPYTAESAMGLMVRHMNDPIPSARAENPALPAAVDELLQQGMAKRPADRPPSAAEFARRLQQAAGQAESPAGQPTSEAADAAGGRGWLWLVIPAFLVVALVCLLVVASAAGGAFFLRATPTAATERLPTLTPSPPPAVTPTPPGLLLADDFSRPGSGFAIAQDSDGGVVYENGGLNFTVLTAGVDWISPSGRLAERDVVIEAGGYFVEGPEEGYVALICRWQDAANYTAFALNRANQAAVWQQQDGERVMLQEWRALPAAAVNEEGRFQLRAVCRDSLLRFSSNNILIAEHEDDRPLSGDIALMAGLAQAGRLEIRFNEVAVSGP